MFFSLFIFLCCFPFCFLVVLPRSVPRYIILLCSPSGFRTRRACHCKCVCCDDLGLVPIFQKNISKKYVIFIFSDKLQVVCQQFCQRLRCPVWMFVSAGTLLLLCVYIDTTVDYEMMIWLQGQCTLAHRSDLSTKSSAGTEVSSLCCEVEAS